MAISRPFLLALLATVLAAATFVVVQNARTDGEETTPVVPVEQTAQPQQQPAATPEATLQAGLNLGRIDSAAFAAELSFARRGQRAAIDARGAYERGAPKDMPQFAVDATVAAEGRRARGGFVSLGERAFFTRGDTGWRVPAPVWEPLVEARAGGGAQPLTLPVDPRRWVRDVKSEANQTLDGVETEHVSATVDPKLVARDLTRAARANGARVPGGPAAARSVTRAELDVWVGANDDLLRRLTTAVAFTNGGRIALDLDLTRVNKPQEISAPAKVRRGKPGGLLGQFAAGLTGGVTAATGGEPANLGALTSGKPRKAARAVKAGKKVVILFRNPRGLDDRAMAPVMREVAARTQAGVLSDDVAAVDRYGKLVEDLGVSQTPSVVLIDSNGKARLLEGFVDAATVVQAVSDAR